MEVKLLNQKGVDIGKVELNDAIFAQKVNLPLINRYLVYQLANARKVVAHTKTRGERRGSTRKIYRQKGTGRARMGANRSPIRKKGGVVFGPRMNRNFTISMNRKERRSALFSALSSKVVSNSLIVLDNIEIKSIKTKSMIEIINNMPYTKNVLLVLPETNNTVEKSAANIANVKTVMANYLNIKDLLKYNTLILTKDSVEKIEQTFLN